MYDLEPLWARISFCKENTVHVVVPQKLFFKIANGEMLPTN
jgi:hypothetical protein